MSFAFGILAFLIWPLWVWLTAVTWSLWNIVAGSVVEWLRMSGYFRAGRREEAHRPSSDASRPPPLLLSTTELRACLVEVFGPSSIQEAGVKSHPEDLADAAAGLMSRAVSYRGAGMGRTRREAGGRQSWPILGSLSRGGGSSVRQAVVPVATTPGNASLSAEPSAQSESAASKASGGDSRASRAADEDEVSRSDTFCGLDSGQTVGRDSSVRGTSGDLETVPEELQLPGEERGEANDAVKMSETEDEVGMALRLSVMVEMLGARLFGVQGQVEHLLLQHEGREESVLEEEEGV